MACNVSSLNILHKNQRNFSNCLNCFLQSCKTFFFCNKTILILIHSPIHTYSYSASILTSGNCSSLSSSSTRSGRVSCSLGSLKKCWNQPTLLLLIFVLIVLPLFNRFRGPLFSLTFSFLLVLFSSLFVFGFATNGSLDAAF